MTHMPYADPKKQLGGGWHGDYSSVKMNKNDEQGARDIPECDWHPSCASGSKCCSWSSKLRIERLRFLTGTCTCTCSYATRTRWNL